MKKHLPLFAVAAVLLTSGCICVNVTDSQRSQIDKMRNSGHAWSIERDAGNYKEVVNMSAAVWWSLLPGAGQMFIAHHMSNSGNPVLREAGIGMLRAEGTMMIGTSWIPLVYVFTFPAGLGGVVVDVNRANNLNLMSRGGASPLN